MVFTIGRRIQRIKTWEDLSDSEDAAKDFVPGSTSSISPFPLVVTSSVFTFIRPGDEEEKLRKRAKRRRLNNEPVVAAKVAQEPEEERPVPVSLRIKVFFSYMICLTRPLAQLLSRKRTPEPILPPQRTHRPSSTLRRGSKKSSIESTEAERAYQSR